MVFSVTTLSFRADNLAETLKSVLNLHLVTTRRLFRRFSLPYGINIYKPEIIPLTSFLR